MYHRPPTVRAESSSVYLTPPSRSSAPSRTASPRPSPRPSPLLPPANLPPAAFAFPNGNGKVQPPMSLSVRVPESSAEAGPTICGMPLKYVSLVTLAVQNAALSIVMHYSRVSSPEAQSYSPASAVLLNEILKGTISFAIALMRVSSGASAPSPRRAVATHGTFASSSLFIVCREIFSPDCWKLSIPALLYVVQNSLQFVAVSNLPVATFQVTYQMKILTTAAFSVALLRRRLSPTKWLSLFFLALGVAVVQIQSTSTPAPPPAKRTLDAVGSAYESAPPDPSIHVHVMHPLRGFAAVAAACFTSGLAGVYFEMVLKGSKADLWVRNVQLSLFSLLPALVPVLFSDDGDGAGGLSGLFAHFGAWAWATVATQVFGGLITAIVIKYSDNILKGFATSLSIILSSLASVALFDFRLTPAFAIGASTVLVATWMYNQPAGDSVIPPVVANAVHKGGAALGSLSRSASSTSLSSLASLGGGNSSTPSFAFPGSPIEADAPILGQFAPPKKKTPSPFGSPRAFASALGLAPEKSSPTLGSDESAGNGFGQTLDTARYLSAPYGSPFATPFPSRSPSPAPPQAPPSNANGNANGHHALAKEIGRNYGGGSGNG